MEGSLRSLKVNAPCSRPLRDPTTWRWPRLPKVSRCVSVKHLSYPLRVVCGALGVAVLFAYCTTYCVQQGDDVDFRRRDYVKARDEVEMQGPKFRR